MYAPHNNMIHQIPNIAPHPSMMPPGMPTPTYHVPINIHYYNPLISQYSQEMHNPVIPYHPPSQENYENFVNQKSSRQNIPHTKFKDSRTLKSENTQNSDPTLQKPSVINANVGKPHNPKSK